MEHAKKGHHNSNDATDNLYTAPRDRGSSQHDSFSYTPAFGRYVGQPNKARSSQKCTQTNRGAGRTSQSPETNLQPECELISQRKASHSKASLRETNSLYRPELARGSWESRSKELSSEDTHWEELDGTSRSRASSPEGFLEAKPGGTSLRRSSQSGPTLLDLPTELLSTILNYACIHRGHIKPEQFTPGSTQFSHEYPLNVNRNGIIIRTPAIDTYGRRHVALTAIANKYLTGPLLIFRSSIQLSQTCRRINDIVINDFLFYKHNRFDFFDTASLLKYLVVLLPERRNAIRSIRVHWDCNMGSQAAAAFTILSTCRGLKYLELDITLLAPFFEFESEIRSFRSAPGWTELMKLRGVNVKLVYAEKDHYGWNFISDVLTVVYGSRYAPYGLLEGNLCLQEQLMNWNRKINTRTNNLHCPRQPQSSYTIKEREAANKAGMNHHTFNYPPGLDFFPGDPPDEQLRRAYEFEFNDPIDLRFDLRDLQEERLRRLPEIYRCKRLIFCEKEKH
ncbi:uncharacterized protein RCO7_01421 [Rhynchosporium graminicola]|uniref:Uncharacterized protein n=1 Tax=Rhynchosporium graminicola TaxID=2792576 RepID=A0A1E1JYU3_9HELO|nr:uncharacterized protein RCO7_01421 [Rhynchosporium commune]